MVHKFSSYCAVNIRRVHSIYQPVNACQGEKTTGCSHSHTNNKYSTTPLIRINRNSEPSGYAENTDNWIFNVDNQIYATITVY
jgi:hypothetical protein